MSVLSSLFRVDSLSIIMMALIGFVSLCVGSFARRYLAGDRAKRLFFICLAGLVPSMVCFVTADNMLLLVVSLSVSNALLARMMMHKKEWAAARASSLLALGYFMLVLLGGLLATYCFHQATNSWSLHTLVHSHSTAPAIEWGISFLMLAALIQSALFPFHRWLLSSLNSPTPVSAIMHAGLINGGGFLLTRFSAVLAQHPGSLMLLFVIGMVTVVLGTVWKCLQSDVKRMLACSTMAQMGFMIVQCGLGLFPAAVAHLCWHGLFKGYLFLSSASSVFEKRFDAQAKVGIGQFVVSLLSGFVGATLFVTLSGLTLTLSNTHFFLIVLAFIASAQLSLPMLSKIRISRLFLVLPIASAFGFVYGLSIRFIRLALPSTMSHPQPLSAVYVIGLALLVFAWLWMVFRYSLKRAQVSRFYMRAYVKLLNASQPSAKTITAHRNGYHY